MIKTSSPLSSLLLSATLTLACPLLHATSKNEPLLTPVPPALSAQAYVLMDANSGKILAEKNSDTKRPPASLTKVLTLYVVSSALKQGQIHLEDTIRVSEKAWKTGGSRMFLKEGQEVSLEDLLKGVIVDSGNDSCVAMAEHLQGSEAAFADLMNQQAERLGMSNSHFTDSTGLPDQNHYSTAKDLALLGRALVNDFPEYYPWYQQKWFTFNGIRQPNRNRLLWRDNQVDGIKTGHTDEAGHCLISSAKRNNMRLIAVVLGEPTETARADDSERLLNYGFRFYETHLLYQANKAIATLPVYKGTLNQITVGLAEDQFITIPKNQYANVQIHTKVPKQLKAPIQQGDTLGEFIVTFDGEVIATKPILALDGVPEGGLFTRMKDGMTLTVKNWFS